MTTLVLYNGRRDNSRSLFFTLFLFQTVYEMMLTDQKEHLHEVCAQWYENNYKGNANYQSVIMHHWMRSSNTPKKARQRVAQRIVESSTNLRTVCPDILSTTPVVLRANTALACELEQRGDPLDRLSC